MVLGREYKDHLYLVDHSEGTPSLHIAPYDGPWFNDNLLLIIYDSGLHAYSPTSCKIESCALAGTAIYAVQRWLGLDPVTWPDNTGMSIIRRVPLLGPLGLAALRATWMEELDGQGRRVPRATQPNEHAASLPTNTTTVVEP